MLGCRMWGRLAKAQHWAGRCPGRLVVGCWARLWARHLARPCASWLRAKRLETARVRSCLVGSAIARGPVEEWVARRWVAFSLAVACVGCALLARAHMQPHLCVQGRVCVLRPVGVLVVLGCAPRGFPDRFGCRCFGSRPLLGGRRIPNFLTRPDRFRRRQKVLGYRCQAFDCRTCSPSSDPP